MDLSHYDGSVPVGSRIFPRPYIIFHLTRVNANINTNEDSVVTLTTWDKDKCSFSFTSLGKSIETYKAEKYRKESEQAATCEQWLRWLCCQNNCLLPHEGQSLNPAFGYRIWKRIQFFRIIIVVSRQPLCLPLRKLLQSCLISKDHL